VNYTVNFKAVDNEEITGTTRENVGKDWVKQIRTETQCPKLPLEIIRGHIFDLQIHEVSVLVSEETANISPLFMETNEVTVIVPPQGLKPFYNLKAVIRQNSGIASVTGVYVEWHLDKEALILAWALAGFPINWSPED